MAGTDVTPGIARAADAACVFTNLDTVTEAATNLFDDALAPAAVTVEQLGYLVCIQGLPGLTVEALAKRKCKDAAHVRAALLRMEMRGWIRSLGDETKPLALTAFGKAKLDDGAHLWSEVQDRIVATIGGDADWKETLDRLSLLHACIMSSR